MVDREAALHVVAHDFVAVGVKANSLNASTFDISLPWVDLWHKLTQRPVVGLTEFPRAKNALSVASNIEWQMWMRFDCIGWVLMSDS